MNPKEALKIVKDRNKLSPEDLWWPHYNEALDTLDEVVRGLNLEDEACL